MNGTQFLELAVSLSVQAAVVVVVVQWLGRLVNSERFQCRLWTFCYAALLVLIAVALFFPHLRVYHPWTGVSAQNAYTLVAVQMEMGRAVFIVWLAGAVLSSVLFCVRSVQAARFVGSCQPVDPAEISAGRPRGEISEMLACSSRRPVRLLKSSRLSTPFCWQFHQPYIVLPEFVLGFGPEELRFIVRHELEHLKTGHPLQLFLQRAVEVMFWFHPMVWWASQQSAASREYACDEAAVDSPSDIAVYLKTLLTIVEYGATEAAGSPTTLAFGRGSSIVARRARRLAQMARTELSYGRQLISASSACAGLAVAIVLVAFVWLPVDVLASPRARWTPWPSWSAGVLHNFGVSVRDFDVYDHRVDLHELMEHESPQDADD